MATYAAPPVPQVVTHDAKREPRGFLHFRLQGRVHDQIGRGRRATLRRQLQSLVGGIVQEEIVRIHPGTVDHHRRMQFGVIGFSLGNRPGIHHRVQHQ